MIPKIVHQTWKNADIPQPCKQFVSLVKDTFKDWQYRFWTDENCDLLIQDKYKFLLPALSTAANNAEKADIYRYCIVHSEGGLYLDIDYEVHKPFEIDFDVIDLFLAEESEKIRKEFRISAMYSNAIFAASKNNTFLLKVLKNLASYRFYNLYKQLNRKSSLDLVEDTLYKTGPLLLTNTFKIDKPLNAFVGKSDDFVESLTDAKYGTHHCHCSWLTRGQRLK